MSLVFFVQFSSSLQELIHLRGDQVHPAVWQAALSRTPGLREDSDADPHVPCALEVQLMTLCEESVKSDRLSKCKTEN